MPRALDDVLLATERGDFEDVSETAPLVGHDFGVNSAQTSSPGSEGVVNDIPPGVVRIESVASKLTQKDRIFILSGVLIIGWSYGLDGLVRYTYQSYAASSFGVHSLLATINILRSVIAAAVHPPAAKFADVVGRFELIAVSVLFYIVGTAIQSTATSIEIFIVGAALYQIGYTCVVLLVEVIIADITSMRSRVFFSYVPAIPFVINTWISGNITSAVMRSADWRWGIGMWCIIYTASAAPLLIGLYKAGLYGGIDRDRRSFRLTDVREQCIEVYTQLDIVGISLAVAVLVLILVPLTVAEGQVSKWRSPEIILPLIVGILCIPAFFYWETKRAANPLLPSYLLKESGVGAALAVRCLLNVTWAVQGNYLYTVLIVAFDFSVTLATRVTAFFTFFGVVSGLFVGLAIYRVRRLKYFIIFGTFIFMVSFGLLIVFNSGASQISRLGMLGAQVLLGIAAGFCAYPTQASAQAATRHEHVSAITGLYLASFNIGSALGTCISGAIWSETLLPTLISNLKFQANPNLAQEIYQSPFEVVPSFPVGTEIRSAIISSYGHVEKLLCITGFCLCVPMIAFAFGLKNPRLSTEQSQPEAGK